MWNERVIVVAVVVVVVDVVVVVVVVVGADDMVGGGGGVWRVEVVSREGPTLTKSLRIAVCLVLSGWLSGCLATTTGKETTTTRQSTPPTTQQPQVLVAGSLPPSFPPALPRSFPTLHERQAVSLSRCLSFSQNGFSVYSHVNWSLHPQRNVFQVVVCVDRYCILIK